MKKVAGVGVELKYTLDKKLFSRYTHNYQQRKLTVCAFVDDGVLLSSTRGGAKVAVSDFQFTSRPDSQCTQNQEHSGRKRGNRLR